MNRVLQAVSDIDSAMLRKGRVDSLLPRFSLKFDENWNLIDRPAIQPLDYCSTDGYLHEVIVAPVSFRIDDQHRQAGEQTHQWRIDAVQVKFPVTQASHQMCRLVDRRAMVIAHPRQHSLDTLQQFGKLELTAVWVGRSGGGRTDRRRDRSR